MAAGPDRAATLRDGRAKRGLLRTRLIGAGHFVQVPIEAVPFMTDHLLSPSGTKLKQLAAEFFQVVQKPSLLSFQVPSPLTPDFPSGSRVILPSAGDTIVDLMFCGVEEVNG